MFTHYLKIAFRNIWKHRTQSLTAIFGLAFGLACFVPALYWMRYETSYDSFYPDAERIYRVYAVEKKSGKVSELVPMILDKKLHDYFPETETSTLFYPEINNCKTETTPHIGLRTLNADSTFFRVFQQEFVSGDTQQPLASLYNIVITESVAIRLFGDVEKAIGQQIQSTYYFFNPPYTVTAVVKDPPVDTNLSFEALLSHDLLTGIAAGPEADQWVQFVVQLYVKFPPHTNVDKLADQLHDFTSRLKVNDNIDLRMVPVSDVRHQLNADMPFTLNFIRLFLAAGILLLFSALFNFLNLFLDLFRQRIRELHLRTVHGASSRRLIQQMLFELICAIILGLLFGCCLVIVAEPSFAKLLDVAIEVPELIRLFVGCGIGVMALLLLIGFILFWRLSRLAMSHQSSRKSVRQPVLRRVAVTLQLVVSVVFVVATLVVMMQIRYVNHKDLGFDRSGIIQLHGLPPYMKGELRTALLQALKDIPQIETIATSNFEPQHKANTIEVVSQVEWPGKSPGEEPTFNIIPTDNHFIKTLGLEMQMGEWFKEGDKNKVVLNEEAVRVMGLTEPIGTIIRMPLDAYGGDSIMAYQVAGVVKDFHTLSLRNRILPTIFRTTIVLVGSQIVTENILYLHVTSGQEQEVIQRIAAILPGIDPAFAALRLTTLEDLYNSFNRAEQAGLQLFSVLATVCLLISLFGIYAVAAAATQRRRKEIAIRKVVGAEAGTIVRLFFREYIVLVIMACIVALPIAYLAMSRWLQGYAYRTNIPWWLQVGVIAGVVAVVLLTVLGQVLKAANSNPAEVVKSE